MKFKKIYLLFLISIFLSGCIQSTALLGPGVTIATTGNIMQAGLQYGANSAIKKETGKDALTHLKSALDEEQDSQKLNKKIRNFTQNIINRVKNKFSSILSFIFSMIIFSKTLIFFKNSLLISLASILIPLNFSKKILIK